MTGVADVDASAPVGTIAAAVVEGVDVAVIRHAEGWVMVADTCTHAHCAFTSDGDVVDGATLICNCHGSEFDLRTGEVLLGPAEVSLTVVALRVEAGALRLA
jgi:nitrite reductase/ring-hydroxylating ferredoxin subunit